MVAPLAPFTGKWVDIASYALLTPLLADRCPREVGALVWSGGDTHRYSNDPGQA